MKNIAINEICNPILKPVFNDEPNNFWVFTGSSETKSNFENIGGLRNLTSHFEEHIRYNIANSSINAKQRYVINTCIDGVGVKQLNQDFTDLIEIYKPKVVAVMIDEKDFITPNKNFETDLILLIGKIIKINAIAIIITPHKYHDEKINLKIKDIIATIKKVSSESKFSNKTIVVDFYDLGTDENLNNNSAFNALGHYKAAQKLALDLTKVAYKIEKFDANLAVVEPYKINISQDKSLVQGIDIPKILFIGDSITHGAAHTNGYDSVPQLFEKALIDLGYNKNIVINTAVSGATADYADNGCLNKNNVKHRLNAFLYPKDITQKPDFAIVMIGTNDTVVKNMNADIFENNIRDIIKIIKEAYVTPILRTPPPVNKKRKDVIANLYDFANKIIKVANEENIIVIDHTNTWTKIAQTNEPNLLTVGKNKVWLNDLIHPNHAGQVAMFKEVFSVMISSDEIEKSKLMKLDYKAKIKQSWISKILDTLR